LIFIKKCLTTAALSTKNTQIYGSIETLLHAKQINSTAHPGILVVSVLVIVLVFCVVLLFFVCLCPMSVIWYCSIIVDDIISFILYEG